LHANQSIGIDKCLHSLQRNVFQGIQDENKLMVTFQHMVYVVHQGHKCFMRHETETVECTAQQKKQDMMDAEDRALEECIEEMRAAALTDLASLAEFVDKYLPQQ